MKVHDHYCGLLIVRGVIMTNEGRLRLDEGKRGNAVTLIVGCQQNTKLAATPGVVFIKPQSADQRSLSHANFH